MKSDRQGPNKACLTVCVCVCLRTLVGEEIEWKEGRCVCVCGCVCVCVCVCVVCVRCRIEKKSKIHSSLALADLPVCVHSLVCGCVHPSDHKSWPMSCYWLSWRCSPSQPEALHVLQLGVKGRSSFVQWNRLSARTINREIGNKEHIVVFYLPPMTFYLVASEMSWRLRGTHGEHSWSYMHLTEQRKMSNKVDAHA